MNKKSMIVLQILVLLTILSACSDNLNSTGEVSLLIQGTKPGDLSRAVVSEVVIPVSDRNRLTNASIVLTDARLGLKKIELKLVSTDSNASDDDNEISFPGPYIVNLLNDTVTPSLNQIQFPEGNYHQIELKLEKLNSEDSDNSGNSIIDPSDPLYNKSIYIKGFYSGITSSGLVSNMPFILSFDFDEEFKLSSSNAQAIGFNIGSDDMNKIIIAFRLKKWFSFNNPETKEDGIDMSTATQTLVNGINILILNENNSDANKKIRDIIKENIKKSADYGKDDDNDGHLSKNEDDDPDDKDENDS